MELKNKEEGPEFYDEIFKNGGKNRVYHRKPEGRTSEIDMWVAVINEIGTQVPIVEFGCGTGQFAQLAIESGLNYKCGIDFSPEAIKLCRKRLPEAENKFAIRNLYSDFPYEYISDKDVVVMLEVLEHLSNDFFILENLQSGTKVIFSVPNFGGQSHVRKFSAEREIEDRYHHLIDIKNIRRFGRRFLTTGSVKPRLGIRITR